MGDRSTGQTLAPAAGANAVEEAARTIDAQFAVALGSEARVAEACATLRAARAGWNSPETAIRLEQLAALVAGRATPLVLPLFDLLDEITRISTRPWPLLGPMLRAARPELVLRAVDALVAAVDEGRLAADDRLIEAVAAIADAPDSPLIERAPLERLRSLLAESAERRYVGSPDAATRRLAARVLDVTNRLPTSSNAAAVLGDAASTFLAPYLEFTRAAHLDLLAFATAGARPARAIASLEAVERRCGAPLLKQAIAAFGWHALNLGLEARPIVGISIGGGLPLLLSPEDASLFDGCPHAERVLERTLLIAHGVRPGATGTTADASVARFRTCNLAHARMLAEFLDMAPLTADRVDRLVAGVGELVADFTALFADERDECRRVESVYRELVGRIGDARARDTAGIAAEVTRLVQPFEDAASPEAVRTLHGLKRYLHQRGLRLGLRLVRSDRHATRTVTIAIADGDRVRAGRSLEYADFDPDAASRDGGMPYAVRVVVDAFAHQLLHGEEKLPSVRAFCYGNEVHYFISFRNHPAFARIDYSPPFAGGMVDLEYYGVSKYELSHHPNLALEGISGFFRRLDFDVAIDTTRIHARYDKERARDVGDLCARTESLFRLAPYLMDVDWVLGNLDLTRDARQTATRAWADRFARWGVLPLGRMLRADNRAILMRDAPHPMGPRERIWAGDLPYCDRVTPDAGAEAEAAAWLREAIRARSLDVPVELDVGDLAQVRFETGVLAPLHAASAARGRPHASSRLAALISDQGAALVEAARVAGVLAPVDRFLQFETIGRVNARLVQHAGAALPGTQLSIAVLRDDAAAPGLAIVDDPGGGTLDATRVQALLREHNFPTGSPPPDRDPATIAAAFSTPGPFRRIAPIEGEQITTAVRASPGVAVGLALFGTAHRAPADVADAILVTDRLSPDDGPFLLKAAGVVCTGGGVLSHAGLLATQFGKPAVVIDARRLRPGGNSPLQLWSLAYSESFHTVGACAVVEQRGAVRREGLLHEGDLVEVNADEGIVRVLGQHRETLAVHDAWRRLVAAEARLSSAGSPEQLLVERGQRAHATHQLQRLLAEVRRADLAAFAVRRLLDAETPAAASAALLRTLLDGPSREVASSCLKEQLSAVAARVEISCRAARERIPVATDPFEVVALHLSLARDAERLMTIASTLKSAGCDEVVGISRPDVGPSSIAARERLTVLNDEAIGEVDRAVADGRLERARHLLAAIDRIGGSLAIASSDSASDTARASLRSRDEAARSRIGGRSVINAADGGEELQPLIGAKAANLGEIARLEPGIPVPPWFAIANAAFQQVLAIPVTGAGGVSAIEAIADVLSRAGHDDRQRSRAISAIWEQLPWPPDLEAAIRAAYRDLSATAGPDAPRSGAGELLVAVRSSAFEEDRPEATRAGEFDTFLFVAGEAALLAHVKRAWSGFWTPRAIRNRAALGLSSEPPGGGILVQQIVDARAAGVVQTIDVADARPWELAIDVAYGLGEGVVSGRVAADHVTVVKRERPGGALRFHYATADKRDRIVFDAARGVGTRRTDTLYHQRMRPALEYAELETLVDYAERLEDAWREALDIEFAVDRHGIWLLQARPVPAFHAAWREAARRLRGG